MAATELSTIVVHAGDPAPNPDKSSFKGLSSADVITIRSHSGWNEIPRKKQSPIIAFLKHFWGLTAWLLEATAIAGLALRQWAEAIVPIVLLVLNAIIGFIQEYRASSAVDALTSQLQIQARVLRDGNWTIVPARELVPGDVVKVRQGDVVPAGSADVDQSALTGESEAVHKIAGDQVFAGTILSNGEMLCKVTAIGLTTKFGKAAELVQSSAPKIHAQALLQRLVYIKLAVVGTLVVIVVVVIAVRGQNVGQAIPTLLSVLVTAMPVALPAMLTITMALGTRWLSKRGVLVSRLAATEDAARMTILCSDKTGTITQNRLSVTAVESPQGMSMDDALIAACLASKVENKDAIDSAVLAEASARKLQVPLASVVNFVPFTAATRCTEATIRTSSGGTAIVRKGAVKTLVAMCNLTAEESAWVQKVVDLHATNGERTLAVIRSGAGGKPQAKAVDDPPKKEHHQEKPANKDKKEKKEKKEKNEKKEKKEKKEKHEKKQKAVQDPVADKAEGANEVPPAGLIEPIQGPVPPLAATWQLLGIIAMADPPRADSKQSIATIRDYGVRVIMLTGDSLAIAKHVADQVGLGAGVQSLAAWRSQMQAQHETRPEILTPRLHGHVETNSRDAQRKQSVFASPPIDDATGFAEVFPEDKHMFVKLLQDKKHVVGMTGDGVNDAPALKQAECGVAVSNATDVAKKAASVVLIPEGLQGVSFLIEEGRRIHARLLTWIFNFVMKTFQQTTFVLLIYLIENAFPMAATQLLLLVLVGDFLTLVVSADNARIAKYPSKWRLLRLVAIAGTVGFVNLGQACGFYYLAKDYLHLDFDQLQTYCFEMMFFFSTQSIFIARERRFFFSSAPFWVLPLFIGVVTVAVFVACTFGLGFLSITSIAFYQQAWLFGMSLGTRFLINDPIKFVLFRFLLPLEQ